MARFQVLGIPVQIDPWFLLGLFFVYSWSGGNEIGLYAALTLGVLTLIHELGHALTARHYGCTSSIRLNLFVGWASYSASRPLSRREQVTISLAGPLTQLGVALAGLAVVHGIIQRTGSVSWWQFAVGLSWAGVVIAFLNLLPLWPLDGGHVVHTMLGRVMAPRDALRAVLVWTLVAIGTIVVVGIVARSTDGGWFAEERLKPRQAAASLVDPSLASALWAQIRALPAYLFDLPWFLLLFTGLGTLQALSSLSQRQSAEAGPVGADAVTAAVAAERSGWATRRVPQMPRGFTASPWLRARIALDGGDLGGVEAALAQVTAPGRRWVLPDPASPELEPLVARLPDPTPVGAPPYNTVLLHVLSWHGPADRLLRWATNLYGVSRDPEVLFVAATGLARRGEIVDAIAWLRRALLERPDIDRVMREPAFIPYRTRPDFQALIAQIPTP